MTIKERWNRDRNENRTDKSINLDAIRQFKTVVRATGQEPGYDVNQIGSPVEGRRGLWKLNGFDDSGVEYFAIVPGTGIELFVWSIAQEKVTGEIHARFDSHLYGHWPKSLTLFKQLRYS